MNDRTSCPTSPSGDHKYFIFKNYDVYELVRDSLSKYGALLYEKKEVAIVACNCGSVLRQEVKAYS